MIVKTISAFCDGSSLQWNEFLCKQIRVPCNGRAALRSSTTQPFRDLADLGWTSSPTDDGMKTFCPTCSPTSETGH